MRKSHDLFAVSDLQQKTMCFLQHGDVQSPWFGRGCDVASTRRVHFSDAVSEDRPAESRALALERDRQSDAGLLQILFKGNLKAERRSARRSSRASLKGHRHAELISLLIKLALYGPARLRS